ncbi:hypothetical protein NMY22_g4042 [Coprinellus aureogranulatus]|nr:hypothetical protein NMY22_g4042 [Coprinellus aureogranulatus]
MEAKMGVRPTLRIDTSGCYAPRSQQEVRRPHPPSQPVLLSAIEPHEFSRGPGPRLPEIRRQHSTNSLMRSKSYTELELPEELPSSRIPLHTFTEIDSLEGKIVLNVCATEIRITEVETKDGYKSIKTIIRPAASISSSTSALSRPLKTGVSPIASFFSRPPTPVSTLKPSRTMNHSALLSPLRTTSWRLPSLGLHTRKHPRGRSSQSFEEEVDYLQSKLEKEAMGGASAIKIAMEVEQSIHIERWPRQRQRRAQRTQPC